MERNFLKNSVNFWHHYSACYSAQRAHKPVKKNNRHWELTVLIQNYLYKCNVIENKLKTKETSTLEVIFGRNYDIRIKKLIKVRFMFMFMPACLQDINFPRKLWYYFVAKQRTWARNKFQFFSLVFYFWFGCCTYLEVRIT